MPALPERTLGDRTVHLAGLQLLPAGRRLSRPARPAPRHRGAVVPCRLLGLYRLEGSLRLARDHRAPARLCPRAEAALRLHAGNGGRRHRPRARRRKRPDRCLARPQHNAAPRRATPDLARARAARSPSSSPPFPLDGGPADVTLAVYDRRHSDAGRERREHRPHARELQHRAPLRDRWAAGTARRRAGRCRRTASSPARASPCWCSTPTTAR